MSVEQTWRPGANNSVICSEQSSCRLSGYQAGVAEIPRHSASRVFWPVRQPSVNSLRTHKLAQTLPQIAAADEGVEHHLPCTRRGKGVDKARGSEGEGGRDIGMKRAGGRAGGRGA